MNKKMIPVGLVVTLVGVAVGYGALQTKVEDTKEDVVKLEKRVDVNVEAIDVEENTNITQTMLLIDLAKQIERNTKQQDKLDRKLGGYDD